VYKNVRKTKKFNTDNIRDLEEYDEILNNPLCSIISERREKLTTKIMDDEGKMIGQNDKMILVVTWDEKILL